MIDNPLPRAQNGLLFARSAIGAGKAAIRHLDGAALVLPLFKRAPSELVKQPAFRGAEPSFFVANNPDYGANTDIAKVSELLHALPFDRPEAIYQDHSTALSTPSIRLVC